MSNPSLDRRSVRELVGSIIERYGSKPTALIMILQDIQEHYRYLPEATLREVATKMNISPARVFEIATFYKTFSLTPKGRNHICVCAGTACHIRQAGVIVDCLERELGISTGETTGDHEFSIETVNCLGACALGPMVTVNGKYQGTMTAAKVTKMLQTLRTPEHETEQPVAEGVA